MYLERQVYSHKHITLLITKASCLLSTLPPVALSPKGTTLLLSPRLLDKPPSRTRAKCSKNRIRINRLGTICTV